MSGRHEIQDTVARALCSLDPPCVRHIAEARVAVSALVLAGHLRVDIQDLVKASSLGTPGAVDRALWEKAADEGCMCYENVGDNSRCKVPGHASPTGGGAGDTPPATSAVPHPAAQADQAIGSPTPPPPDIRRFYLHRHVDHSSVSGTGIVAWGAQWPDNTASLRWAGLHPSTVAWANVERIVAVHGHQGSTELRWLDGEPS